jgi:hypothetical protein
MATKKQKNDSVIVPKTSDDKLRELLTNRILESIATTKPSKLKLQNMDASSLVSKFFEVTANAEILLWNEDIKKQIVKLNPKIKTFKNTMSRENLISLLIETAQN